MFFMFLQSCLPSVFCCHLYPYKLVLFIQSDFLHALSPEENSTQLPSEISDKSRNFDKANENDVVDCHIFIIRFQICHVGCIL